MIQKRWLLLNVFLLLIIVEFIFPAVSLASGVTSVGIERLGPREGIIMNDNPYHPKSYEEAFDMGDRGEHYENVLGHTGWSVWTGVCRSYPDYSKGGYRYEYDQTSQYSTFNQRDSGSLNDYIDQLNQKYSHLGVNFEEVDGHLWGIEWWKVHNEKDLPPCNARNVGYKAYDYWDNDILMEGVIEIVNPKPDPSLTKGAVKGEAYWELRRDDRTKDSNAHAYSKFLIAGKHYATKTPRHEIKFDGKTYRKTGDGSVIQAIANGLDVKGTTLDYRFEYEYTNYKKRVCSGTGEDRSCWWVPDWERGETFVLEDKIKVDPPLKDVKQGETFSDVVEKKYIVGRQDTYSPNKKSTPYYEQMKRAKGNDRSSHVELLSQSTLPITEGELRYEVELPSGEHKKNSFNPLRIGLTYGNFFPADVDDSLKESYSNSMKEIDSNYAFPLQQHTMNDKGMSGDVRAFEWSHVTDVFAIGKHTGFITGVSYAQEVRDALEKGSPIPDTLPFIEQANRQLKPKYEDAYGEKYVDTGLYQNKSDFEKMQRYYLPVSPITTLKPLEKHTNYYVMNDVGLNDLTFEYGSTFMFKHYLFGSGADEAFYIEQKDSRVSIDGSKNKVHQMSISYDTLADFMKLKEDRKAKYRVHELRFSDRDFVDKIRALLN